MKIVRYVLKQNSDPSYDGGMFLGNDSCVYPCFIAYIRRAHSSTRFSHCSNSKKGAHEHQENDIMATSMSPALSNVGGGALGTWEVRRELDFLWELVFHVLV